MQKKRKVRIWCFLDTLLVRMLLTACWMRRAVPTNQLRNIVAQVLYSSKHASYNAQTWQVHYQIEGLKLILACPLSAQLVLYVDSERCDCRNDRISSDNYGLRGSYLAAEVTGHRRFGGTDKTHLTLYTILEIIAIKVQSCSETRALSMLGGSEWANTTL